MPRYRVSDSEAGLYSIDGPNGYLDADEVVALLDKLERELVNVTEQRDRVAKLYFDAEGNIIL